MKRRIHKSFRPTLEGLETRLVPAMIAVTTSADVVNPKDGVRSLRAGLDINMLIALMTRAVGEVTPPDIVE